MFGYVITNCKTLSDEQRDRFRAMYCGLCRTLKRRYGNIERFTLSYDLTFVAMVLSALYEPEETAGTERCASHPFREHAYIENTFMDYAADMNVLLGYHKCMDNWQDDRNPLFAGAAALLKNAYEKAGNARPEQAAAIEEWMRDIRLCENEGCMEIDVPVNLTGKMFGSLFSPKDDVWKEHLFNMGSALGRFIYFMDAYEDLKADVRRKKYNPLKSVMDQPDYEAFCKDAMTMMLAECADEFEQLPIVKDADLIRNIIYSGVWARYGYIQQKLAKSKGAK